MENEQPDKPPTELIQMKSADKTSKTVEQLIRESVVILGETYQYIVSPSLFNIWVMLLSDIEPQLLGIAFNLLLKTWKPDYGRKFPAPADLRALLDDAYEELQTRKGEKAWNDTIRRWKTQGQELPAANSGPVTREQFQEAFNQVRAKLSVNKTPPYEFIGNRMTDEEFEALKARERKKIDDWMASHPSHKKPSDGTE